MPAASSIYWNSIDSQRSSGESSGSGRNYVDPWDLENYAYLRRHSVPTPVYQSQSRYGHSRLSRHSRVESDYWYIFQFHFIQFRKTFLLSIKT